MLICLDPESCCQVCYILSLHLEGHKELLNYRSADLQQAGQFLLYTYRILFTKISPKNNSADHAVVFDHKDEIAAGKNVRFAYIVFSAGTLCPICTSSATRLTPNRICPIPAIPEIAAFMPEESAVPSTWGTPRTTSIIAVRFRPI